MFLVLEGSHDEDGDAGKLLTLDGTIDDTASGLRPPGRGEARLRRCGRDSGRRVDWTR